MTLEVILVAGMVFLSQPEVHVYRAYCTSYRDESLVKGQTMGPSGVVTGPTMPAFSHSSVRHSLSDGGLASRQLWSGVCKPLPVHSVAETRNGNHRQIWSHELTSSFDLETKGIAEQRTLTSPSLVRLLLLPGWFGWAQVVPFQNRCGSTW